MTQTPDRVRWTTEDLKLLPDSSHRYEIIDGQLLMTRAPIGNIKKQLGKRINCSISGQAPPN
jgi:hypothetical protein